jgi:dTDP-glucose pyrophosphorylase
MATVALLADFALQAKFSSRGSQFLPMINIVIPMAGEGSRFASAGFTRPKPLIPVNSVPMIELVVRNIAPKRPHRFVFICQAAHARAFDLVDFLAQIAPGCSIVELTGTTEGAACSVLKAKPHIDNDAPMMIANSDQFIDGGADAFIEDWLSKDIDGSIMTMFSRDPKWSFAAVRSDGLVDRVAEKEPISDQATVGLYGFSKGGDFVAAAESMIAKNLRVRGEFYVAPGYNELIGRGRRIGIHNIGPVNDRMHGLGTPEDLAAYLSHVRDARTAC